MSRKTEGKLYARPTLQKRRRLSDVTESDSILVTGRSVQPKGGCFSNNR